MTSGSKRKRQTKKKEKPTEQEKAKIEGVLFVPLTDKSKLKKTIQDMEDNVVKYSTVGRIKVVERAGASLAHLICNMTPWKTLECGRQGCKPCTSKPSSCKERNLTYEAECIQCKVEGKVAIYHGETHRTLWDRTREHEDALMKSDSKNSLVAHWKQNHSVMEEAPTYTYNTSKI